MENGLDYNEILYCRLKWFILRMKVLLIWPYGAFDGQTMPLCYIYLVPLIRKYHDIEFLDCGLHKIHPNSKEFSEFIQECKPDVVGISAWTIHKDMATLTLKTVKSINSNIITIAGGPHFTGAADYSIEHDKGIIDYVLKGEGEETFKQFLDTISKDSYTEEELSKIFGLCFIKKDGNVHETPMVLPPSLDEFGQPDYSVIDLPGYLKHGYLYRSQAKMQAPILTTRGCPYTCDFCSAPYLNGRGIRKHSLAYLKELITNLYDDYGIRHFNIIDDNFTFDTHFAKGFCKMITDNKKRFKGITFGTPNGIRVERSDQQLFYLLKAAGWSRLIIAPESGSQKMIDRMSKHLDLNIVPEKVKQIQKAGIETEAFFIVGHPGENKITVNETKEFIKKVKFDMISIHIFQPLRGTPIYDQLLMAGSISQDVNMTSFKEINWLPENWTKNELLQVILDLKKISVENFPSRFEWLFSKFVTSGKISAKIIGEKNRHKLFINSYNLRRKIWNWYYNFIHGNELKKEIEKVIIVETNEEERRKRENKLKEYERKIMEKSDQLSEKAMTEQLIEIKPNQKSMDLLLNDCEKIKTHKSLFMD